MRSSTGTSSNSNRCHGCCLRGFAQIATPKIIPYVCFPRISPSHDAALLRCVLHAWLVLLRCAQLQLLLPPALQFAWAQQQSQPQPTSLDLHGQPYLPMGGYQQQQQQQQQHGMPPQQQLPYGTPDAYHAGPLQPPPSLLQPLPQYMPVAAAVDMPPNFPGLPDFVGGNGGLANSMSGSVGGGVPGYAPSSVPAYGTSGSDPAYGGGGGGGSDPAYGGGGGGSDPMGVPSRNRVSSGSSGNVDIGGSGSWGSHSGAAATAGSGAAARPGSAAVGATPMAARVGSGGAGGIDDTGSPAALHVEDKIAKIKEKNRWAGQWRCATFRWASTGDERNDVHVFQATAVYVLAGNTGHLVAVAPATKYSRSSQNLKKCLPPPLLKRAQQRFRERQHPRLSVSLERAQTRASPFLDVHGSLEKLSIGLPAYAQAGAAAIQGAAARAAGGVAGAGAGAARLHYAAAHRARAAAHTQLHAGEVQERAAGGGAGGGRTRAAPAGSATRGRRSARRFTGNSFHAR